MSWAKLDDNFPDHPKIVAAGPMAGWLYVCGLCFCNRFTTDGFIPETQVRRLVDLPNTDELADRLIDVGLWEQAKGGYQVHDYLEHQSSREHIETVRKARAEAGAKGGSKTQSNRKQTSSKLLDGGFEHVSSKTQAEERSKKEELRSEELREGEKASQAPPPTPRPVATSRATSFPQDFAITAAMEVWAAKNVPELDLEAATDQWQDAMRANRSKYKYTDWGLAWQNAMRNAAKWAHERPVRSNNGNGTDRPSKLARSVAAIEAEYAGLDEIQGVGVWGKNGDYQAGYTPKRLQPPKSA